MPTQPALFAADLEPLPVSDDLPALIRRFARKLATLHGGDPDAPLIDDGDTPAWHYHIDDAHELLEGLIGLLARDTLPSDVVSRRRQRAAAKTLRALMKSDQPLPPGNDLGQRLRHGGLEPCTFPSYSSRRSWRST